MAEFHEKLKRLRTSRGWSQDKLADKLNTSRSSIGNYETGLRKPDYEMLVQIANIFNVDVDYLIGNQDKQKKLTLSDYVVQSLTKGLEYELIEEGSEERFQRAIEIARRYMSATNKERKLVEQILEDEEEN